MAKMGRPKLDINWTTVDSLLAIQCTQAEIGSVIKVSEDTLARRCEEAFGITFADYSAQKRLPGRVSLRRKQYELAMAGDKVMNIWLGKQWLGQSEKIEQSATVDHKGLVTITLIDLQDRIKLLKGEK